MRTLLNIFSKKTKGFNICHFNARSIKPKMTEVQAIFENVNLHSIFVSETWLNRDVLSNSVGISGFKLFRHDRGCRRGGGVAIFVRDCFKSKIIKRSRNHTMEFLAVEVSCAAEKLILIAAYRPPGVFDPASEIEIGNFLNDLSKRYPNLVIGGDFNVDLLHQNSSADSFLHFFQTCHLTNINNNIPTYYSCDNPSLLDYFFSSDVGNVLFHNQLTSPSTFDHDFIFLSYNISLTSLSNVIRFRSYDKVDLLNLLGEATTLPWGSIRNHSCVGEQLQLFYDMTTYLHDKYAPLRVKRVMPQRIPWYSPEIDQLIEEREHLYRKYKRRKSAINFARYKTARNKANVEISRARKKYFNRILDPSLPPRNLWSNLKRYGICGKDSPTCDLNANDLNTYFAASINRHSDQTALNMDLDQDDCGNFSFRSVSHDEVLNAFMSIRSDATGSDEISPRFFKMLLPVILDSLVYIFNSCLTYSIFPHMWKNALVIPLAKCSAPGSLCDYRPISLLCFLSKVLERLMSTQIRHYVEGCNYISKWQSGFRSGHSCETALLKVSTDIRDSLDNDLLTILVLLDFSKAFDSVDHNLLLSKLHNMYKFSNSAVRIISNFLSNRSQQVKVGNERSEWIDVGCGVPQGSILGPMLFCLFINDLPNVIKDVNIHMYADDVQIYLSRPIGLIEDCAHRINSDLINISSWASRNHLLLNPNKSASMVMYRRDLVESDLPRIMLNGVHLPYLDRLKNLGVHFNTRMECCDQVNSILRKVYGGLRLLWLSHRLLASNLKLKLVKALLIPHFTFCSTVYSQLDSECNRKLNTAFNDCVRYIYNLRRHDHVSAYKNSILGCSLNNYLDYRGLLFLNNLINTKNPSYLHNHLRFSLSSRLGKLIIPRAHYLVGQRSFFKFISNLWNSLPVGIRRLNRSHNFKHDLKHFLNMRQLYN